MERLGQTPTLAEGVRSVLNDLNIDLTVSLVDSEGYVNMEAVQIIGDQLATKIVDLGRKRAEGFTCNKEVSRLARALQGSGLLQESAQIEGQPSIIKDLQQYPPKQNPPFYAVNERARTKIGGFCRAARRETLRGPKRHSCGK